MKSAAFFLLACLSGLSFALPQPPQTANTGTGAPNKPPPLVPGDMQIKAYVIRSGQPNYWPAATNVKGISPGVYGSASTR